jgi:hypothetical protein
LTTPPFAEQDSLQQDLSWGTGSSWKGAILSESMRLFVLYWGLEYNAPIRPGSMGIVSSLAAPRRTGKGLCGSNVWTKQSRLLMLLFAGLIVLALVVSPVASDDSCGHPGNLTYNCNFGNFVDRGSGNSTPDGWWPWVMMGSPAFDRDDHGSAPGAPAQRIWSDGGVWTAGLYQSVEVAPAKWYEARIDWAAPNVPGIERRVGIDPSGGSDPASPRVVWGASSWEQVRMPDLWVTAFAQGPTVTIFVWTHHGMSYGADQVFLDAVTLVERSDLSAPTASPQPPSPTPTRRPPTATAKPVPPSPTATEPPTAVPTETETPLPTPTETPTASPTPTWTATPSPLPPTDTPTSTPPPTLTPLAVARVVRTPPVNSPMMMVEPSARQGVPGQRVLLYVAAAALVGALFLGAMVLALWIRSRKAADERD